MIFGKKPANPEKSVHSERSEKQEQVERFYALLKGLMDELFEYAPKSKHVKMPHNASFGLIYDERESVLFTGTDKKSGKKVYLFNVRIIGKMFEEKRKQMLADQNADSLFSWIGEVCSLYIRPFVYEFVVNVQHRGQGAAERTTRKIVRGFLEELLHNPQLKYVVDNLRSKPQGQKPAGALVGASGVAGANSTNPLAENRES